MKSNITLFITSILISIFIFQGCSTKKKAKGPEDEIVVISDSLEYLEVEGTLKEVFGKVIHTPQPEELFSLNRKSLVHLESLKQKKNIIILAPLGSGSRTSEYLESIVDENVANLIKSDSVFVINKYNLWAENQLVMILSSPNMNTLKLKLLDQKDELLFYFRDVSNKRLAKGLHNSLEQKNVEAHFLTKYGWMINVQADYQLTLENSEHNFVWLRRGINTEMERWVFVHWIENASPEFLNIDSITNERNSVTKMFYKTTDDSAYVELYDDYKMDSEVNFNGKYALMTQGLWRFNDLSGGGPFISYTFYDEQTRRIYMIDASIFAPKYFKKNLLQEVDVLLNSFRAEHELDLLVKEDILEELD